MDPDDRPSQHGAGFRRLVPNCRIVPVTMNARLGLLLIGVCLSAALAGCLIVPLPDMALRGGERAKLIPGVLATLKTGKSTIEDVVSRLKAPDGVSDNGRKLSYRWTAIAGLWAVPELEGAGYIMHDHACTIEFDERGVLVGFTDKAERRMSTDQSEVPAQHYWLVWESSHAAPWFADEGLWRCCFALWYPGWNGAEDASGPTKEVQGLLFIFPSGLCFITLGQSGEGAAAMQLPFAAVNAVELKQLPRLSPNVLVIVAQPEQRYFFRILGSQWAYSSLDDEKADATVCGYLQSKIDAAKQVR